MKLLKDLFHGKGYIDGITIINLKGEILFTAKLNQKLSQSGHGGNESDLIGKNLFEVFKNLNSKNSTMVHAMETGLPTYVENQSLQSDPTRKISITSLSIPIKSGDRVVGAIDLSLEEDEESTRDTTEKIDFDSVHYPAKKDGELVSKDVANFSLKDIIAVNKEMRKAKDYIPVMAGNTLPTMIYGETGTGKEVFAQAIHNASARRDKPFIAQNCAAIPETLLESILFGTTKGAFTGAMNNKGLFELADGGTLFLDEINSMPINLQPKILRVIQDGSFRRVGGNELIKVDVKIISAMNVTPQTVLKDKLLRRDLYYRLSMLSVRIPPLRERKEDIPSFVKLYILKHNNTFHKHVRYVSKELLEKLQRYSWPGNIRELEHFIVYGMSMVNAESDTLSYENVADQLGSMLADQPEEDVPEEDKESLIDAELPLTEMLQLVEKNKIQVVLSQCSQNVSKAAKLLGIPRQTLQRKIEKYHL